MQLTVTDINGIHLDGAALEEAIHKTACRAADVGSDLALWADPKGIERAGQLHPATAYKGMLSAQNLDLSVFGDAVPRLEIPPVTHQHKTRQKKALRLLPAGRKPAVYQEPVETE